MSTNESSKRKRGNEELTVSKRAKEMQRLTEELEKLRAERFPNRDEIKRLGALHFDVLCCALRCNDPTVHAVSGACDFPVGYALELGQALSNQNTQVSSMEIYFENLLPTTDEVGGMSPTAITKHLDPLVQHLKVSSALRTVEIFSSFEDKENGASEILGACLQNRDMEELLISLYRLPVPRNVFFDCERFTSLKKFTFHSHIWEDSYSHHEMQSIGDAFKCFSSLTDLDIETGDWQLPASIFEGVQRGGYELDRLVLRVNGDQGPGLWTSLAAMLHSPRMNQFKHLHLRYFHFDAESTVGLVGGLQGRNDSGPQISVSELTLEDCSWTEESSPLFLRFMRTRSMPPQGGITSVPSWTLKKLNLHYPCSLWTDEEEPEFPAKQLVSMLSMGQDRDVESNGDNVYYRTIGSQVESLSLMPFKLSIADFLNRLRKRARRIRLEELTLDHLDGNRDGNRDSAPLAKCIARVESLRSVTIPDTYHPSYDLLCFAVALRENGNIQYADIKGPNNVTKPMQAYCERNQLLDSLLKTSSCTAKPDSPDDTAATEVRTEHQKTYGGKSFCPALWQATNHTPKAGPSKLLGSLLDLCESLAT